MFLRFNGDHVEGTSCGSKSNDDDVCLHWEAQVVQWEVARKKMQSSKERLHFSCVYPGGNGDHVEGTSCGSKSKDDDVCLHWETHVVQWEVARKKMQSSK